MFKRFIRYSLLCGYFLLMMAVPVMGKTKYPVSDHDIELIALVTMAEAEGECERGKRLVIDTILNRMDSGYFPNTAEGVIYQPAQFSSMWNGRVYECSVQDDICKLVREEIENRTSYLVMFFSANDYSEFGVPLYKIQNHYFSSYDRKEINNE
jgi:N-acetylmuramoyl-L-alanine amidase